MDNAFIMNSSFTELSFNELIDTNGGINWLKVGGGALIIVGTLIVGGSGIGVAVGIVGGVLCVIDGL